MRGNAVEVVLSGEECGFLEVHVRKHKATRPLSDRCGIIFPRAEGLRSREIAGWIGVHEHTVGKWCVRFAEKRTEGPCGRSGMYRGADGIDPPASQLDCQRAWAVATLAIARSLSLVFDGSVHEKA